MSEKKGASPRRMIEEPEFHELLKAIAKEELSEARLAENGLVVADRIAQGAKLAIGTKATLSLLGSKGALFAVAITAIATVGTIVSLEESAPSEAGPGDVLVLKKAPAFSQRRLKRAAPSTRSSRAPSPRHKNRNASALKRQLALMQKARKHAKTNEHSSAVQALDLLQKEFPKTKLYPELLMRRAESNKHLGHYESAVKDVQEALKRSALYAKKPELYRFLGDLHRALGACQDARSAYLNAIGLGLSGAGAKAARAGIKACKGG